MTENEIRDKMCTKFKSWCGAKEGGTIHKQIVDIYNSRKPLPRGYAVKISDPWCAITTSACAIACGLDDIVPIECSCSKLIELAKTMGIWVENDNYSPKPADLILYDWNDSGVGDCIGAPEHVGLILNNDGHSLTIIEGNYNDMVKLRTYTINNRYIRGFITPKYNTKAAADDTQIPLDIINGKYDEYILERIARILNK